MFFKNGAWYVTFLTFKTNLKYRLSSINCRLKTLIICIHKCLMKKYNVLTYNWNVFLYNVEREARRCYWLDISWFSLYQISQSRQIFITNQRCICIQIYPKTETFCQILYMSRRQLFNSINIELKYLKVKLVDTKDTGDLRKLILQILFCIFMPYVKILQEENSISTETVCKRSRYEKLWLGKNSGKL